MQKTLIENLTGLSFTFFWTLYSNFPVVTLVLGLRDTEYVLLAVELYSFKRLIVSSIFSLSSIKKEY